jgi:hypothetical protein
MRAGWRLVQQDYSLNYCLREPGSNWLNAGQQVQRRVVREMRELALIQVGIVENHSELVPTPPTAPRTNPLTTNEE